MTQDLLVNLGEELVIKGGIDGITVNVGLYDENTDDLGEGSDLGAISSEPGNANYATQSVTLTASDLAGNWGVDNDSQIEFDFTDTQTRKDVDTAYISYTFQASDTSDSSAQEHLIANPSLSQYRDVGSIDYFQVSAGDLQITLD